MHVSDIKRNHEIESIGDLNAILAKRYENESNGFWLSHESAEYPMLGVFVKKDLAYLHYIPAEYDAGFASVGGACDLPTGETTRFPMSVHEGDDIFVRNEAVIPVSVAFCAVRDFFSSRELPNCVEWKRL